MSYDPLDKSILSQIEGFNKRGLKPTETVERHNTYIADPEKSGGSFDEDEITEYQDEPNELREKIKRLAEAVKACSYLVAYTGAGISTSAKIPDYRGPQGVWTMREKGIRPMGPKITLEQAIPTYSHMSMVALQNNNILKHVVSTNVDGLHIRSGIQRNNLSELHGNCYQEKCAACGEIFDRTYDCTKNGCRSDHWTGNYCSKPGCKGKLLDTIINFGENLPQSHFSTAKEHSKLCDLALVCGTSMRVAPACNLPEYSYKKQGGKLVICNRQKTPYDKYAYLKIHADLDDVFVMLMEELHIDVPSATPEGHPVKIPVLNLEEKYENFQHSIALKKQQVEDKQKTDAEIRNPKLQLQNAVPFMKQKQNFVEGKNETRTVSLPQGTLAYFKSCQDCTYTITDKLSKVIIESCENLTLHLNSVVMTGTCEVIKSKGLKLHISQPIPTLQIELSENCQVKFSDASLMKNIYSARCTNLEISNNHQQYKVPAEKDVGEDEWRDNQYLTRFRQIDSSSQFVTDAVVREGGGYATTQKEKDAHDKMQKKNEALMQQFVKDMMKAQNKN